MPGRAATTATTYHGFDLAGQKWGDPKMGCGICSPYSSLTFGGLIRKSTLVGKKSKFYHPSKMHQSQNGLPWSNGNKSVLTCGPWRRMLAHTVFAIKVTPGGLKGNNRPCSEFDPTRNKQTHDPKPTNPKPRALRTVSSFQLVNQGLWGMESTNL